MPASEAEREAALVAVKPSDHGDVEIWIGYELPSGSDPGTMANYDGENGLTMEEVGVLPVGLELRQVRHDKSVDTRVHHTTVATGGGTPGYYMVRAPARGPGCSPAAKRPVGHGRHGEPEEMQAACEQGGGRLAACRVGGRAAGRARGRAGAGSTAIVEICGSARAAPGGSGPGTMANYDGENGLTMEEVGYLWDPNCGKCGNSKSRDRCVHHTTVATGGNTPGYYMATCSGPRPGVCARA